MERHEAVGRLQDLKKINLLSKKDRGAIDMAIDALNRTEAEEKTMICVAYIKQPCMREGELTVKCCRKCTEYENCKLLKCNNEPERCRMFVGLKGGTTKCI